MLGRPAAVATLLVCAAPLVACTAGSLPGPSESSPAPTRSASVIPPETRLYVRCSFDLTTELSADSVIATSAGVALMVSSGASVGTDLGYSYADGGGSAEVPQDPTPLDLVAPPGPLSLRCANGSRQGAAVQVEVVDPGGWWSTTTLADLGCRAGAVLDWAVGPGTGPTREDAVRDVAADFAAEQLDPTTARRAEVGYRDDPRQTWLLDDADGPYLTVVVVEVDGAFEAYPSALCG